MWKKVKIPITIALVDHIWSSGSGFEYLSTRESQTNCQVSSEWPKKLKKFKGDDVAQLGSCSLHLDMISWLKPAQFNECGK
ncbi:hypothetical protein BTVI_29595 [Pitangus sulphuratus]|nr:hypothetical protein BTVI_29595 [Pitangus sulphuratus]